MRGRGLSRLGAAGAVLLCLVVVLAGSAAADDAQKLSIADVSVNEAAGTATFAISLSAGADADADVDWATSNNSAAAGEDYAASNGSETVPAGASVDVTVPITNDSLDENVETFTVTLSNPDRATIDDATATGTIADNDDPPATTGISDVSVTEGDSGVVSADFTVALSASSGRDITLRYSTNDGSAVAPGDYTAELNQDIEIPAGSTTGTISIDVNGDNLPEPGPAETFFVNLLSSPNNTVTVAGDTQGRATITDDDDQPTVASISDPTVAEGNSGEVDAIFTVTLSGNAPAPVAIGYATTDGSATAPSDYTAASGTVTIPTGQSSGTVTIKVKGDNVPEGSGDPRTENFHLDLTSVSGAQFGSDRRGTATITDNDTPPTVTSIGDPTVTEGNSGDVDANFVVTLSGNAPTPVTIAYATADGSATSPADYAAATGTLTIAAGQATGTITIKVKGDTLPEGASENFHVDLTSVSGAQFGGDRRGTGTITDDDAQRSLSITGADVTEGDGGSVNLDFKVRLSGATAQRVEVTATTADGSAVAPADYQAKTQVLVWTPNTPAAELEKVFRVVVNGDAVDEVNETLTVTLSAPQNATIGAGAAAGTIRDNDNRSLLSIGNAEANEGAAGVKSTMTFKVTLSPVSARPVSMTYATANGTATAGSDYEAKSGQLSFGPGETEKTIEIAILGDDVNEDNETVLVNLSNVGGAALAAGGGQGQGTIVDKNAPPSLSINDVQARESEGAEFTVTLAGTTLRTVTVTFGTNDGSAKQDADYSPRRGTLTFAPGEKTKTVVITVRDDTESETAETFSVGLGNPTNATITKATGMATIEASDLSTTGAPTGTGNGLNNERPGLNVTPKPTGPAAGVLPSMVLSPNTLYRGRRVRMQAGCNQKSAITCTGTIILETATKPKLKLGQKSFSIRKGKKVYLWISISAKGQKLLAEKRTLRVRLIVDVKSSTKKTRRVVPGVITLKMPKSIASSASP